LEGAVIVQFVKRIFLLLLLMAIALQGFDLQANAEQLNNSVKDCMEHPETCGENQVSTDQEEPTSRDESTNVGLNAWDFIKMIFATIFVIALLYFLLKFINKRSKQYKSTQLVENLGGTTLGTNRSVQLIKVGEHILVVG